MFLVDSLNTATLISPNSITDKHQHVLKPALGNEDSTCNLCMHELKRVFDNGYKQA